MPCNFVRPGKAHPTRPIKRPLHRIVVRALSRKSTRGSICLGALTLPCALGRSGRVARKREGDGATPIGRFPIRFMFFRSDRLPRPSSAVYARSTTHNAGWCDAVRDRNYNREIRHPYPASAERLWRNDALYDVIVVLGYNDNPRQPGAGSAIFLHVARPDLSPTEGCIALRFSDLRRFLRLFRLSRQVLVVA